MKTTKGIVVKETKSQLGLTVTTNTIDLICRAVGTGLDYERSAVASGLSVFQARKLRRDMLELAEGSEKSQAFTDQYKALLIYAFDKLASAQAEGELRLLDKINRAAEIDWKAADRLLQIMRPDRYSKRTVIINNDVIPQKSNKELNFDEMSDEQLRSFVEGEFKEITQVQHPVTIEEQVDEHSNSNSAL